MSWTTIDSLWQPKKERYSDGFRRVRRTEAQAHEGYTAIVVHAKQVDQLNPRYSQKDSSHVVSSKTQAEFDIFGLEDPELAHLIPRSPVCSPTWAIFAQGVVGVDFEAISLEKKTKITALQQLVLGKCEEDKKLTGLRYSPLNLLPMAAGHRYFFDHNPMLLVIPVMDLGQVKIWKAGTEYYVMCIVGDWGSAKGRKWSLKIFGDIPSNCNGDKLSLCGDKDIDKATALLSDFTRAHADVLTGRGRDDSLTPADLFYDGAAGCTASEIEERKKVLKTSKDKILGENKKHVMVPQCTGLKNHRVLKVKLSVHIPDPALLACKAAVGWSERCSEKLLPSCYEMPPALDLHEQELYDMAQEEYDEMYAESIRPPADLSELAKALSGSQPRVVAPEMDDTK